MILNRLCPALFLLYISLGSIAQHAGTDSSASVISYWKKGDIARFLSTKIKEKYTSGELISSDTSTFEIEFTVVNATKKSYLINWKYEVLKTKGKDFQDLIAQKYLKLTEGITFRYRTNELGEFQELLNWKEIQNSVYSGLESLGSQANDSAHNKLISEMKQIYSSRESIQGILMRDVQLFHTLYGGEYKLKQKIIQRTALPNFLGGNPFPATITAEMTALEDDKKHCIIQMSQTIDKDQVTKEMSDWFEKLGKPPSEKIPLLNMVDMYEFTVDLVNGWIVQSHSNRTVEINNIREVEIRDMKKI